MHAHICTLKTALAPRMQFIVFGLSIKAPVFEALLRLSLFTFSLDTVLTNLLRSKQIRNHKLEEEYRTGRLGTLLSAVSDTLKSEVGLRKTPKVSIKN